MDIDISINFKISMQIDNMSLIILILYYILLEEKGQQLVC